MLVPLKSSWKDLFNGFIQNSKRDLTNPEILEKVTTANKKTTAVDIKQATANMGKNLSDIYFKIEAGIRATVSTQNSFFKRTNWSGFICANIMSKEFLFIRRRKLYRRFIDNKAKYDAAS